MVLTSRQSNVANWYNLFDHLPRSEEAALSDGHDNADVDKILMDALSLLDLRQEHLAAALVGQALTWLRWQDEDKSDRTANANLSTSR